MFILNHFYSVSQSPGGVSSGLNLWLKSDYGLLNNGTTVSLWYDFSNYGMDGLAFNNPQYVASQQNYNPAVFFNGCCNSYLSNGSSYFKLPTGFNNFNGLTSFVSAVPTSNGAFSRFYDFGNGTANNNLLFGRLGSLNRLFSEVFYNSSGAQLSAPNQSLVTNDHGIFSTKSTGSTNQTQLFNNGNYWNVGSSQPILNVNRTLNYIGLSNWPWDAAYQGYMNEIILYNRELSLLEMKKVYTYLAIKYGQTLHPTYISNQYLNTNGNVVYADAGTYWNEIIGIGRDDIELLYQRQSKTIDDSVQLYISDLSSSNALNNGTFDNDIEYLVIGHNNGKLNSSISSNIEIPSSCYINSRMEREWKVYNTNSTTPFSLNVKLENNSSLSNLQANKIVLLVDNDGNFQNGGTQCYYNGDGSGLVISTNGSEITLNDMSNIILPINSVRYFTVAAVTIDIALPIELISFNATPMNELCTVKLDWQTATEQNSDFFTVEKSQNGESWQQESQVNAAGNSVNLLNYSSYDNNPYRGLSYYRLKQTDLNGNVTVSDIKSVDLSAINNLNLYPNPSENYLIIELDKKQDFSFGISNINGQSVSSLIGYKVISENSLEIDISLLEPGVYFIQTTDDIFKFIKQ